MKKRLLLPSLPICPSCIIDPQAQAGALSNANSRRRAAGHLGSACDTDGLRRTGGR